MTDANHAHDLALLANTPAQAKSWLHCLEKPEGGIGLNMNANKTEYMGFKQKGAISRPTGRLLKLVDQFEYISSNIQLTESDVNICLVKAWNVIDRLLEILSIQ